MPTYEFKCPKCGDVKEITVPMREMPAYLKCGRCRKKMDRVYGTIGVVWKDKLPPGEDYKRKREDAEIQRKVRKAKSLKQSGKVAMDEVIRLEDQCLQEDKDYKGQDPTSKK